MSQPDEARFAAAVRSSGYELGDLAGHGGSGSVYRATNVETGTPVALKFLNRGVDRRRIEREAEALAKLNHQGVAQLIEVLDVDGEPVLVSQWADGQSLAAILALQSPLAPDRALHIVRQLADALDHVHGAGLVHRDLSPDNIMVGVDDSVMLIDFGISRGADSDTLTNEGISAGTPRYLAPEVLEGSPASPASDQYSVAVVLYEMLTGRWPYGETGESFASTLHHHLHSAAVAPSEVNEWLPVGLDATVLRGLAKDPDERFPAMANFVDEAAGGSLGSNRRPRSPGAGARAAVLLVALAAVALAAVLLFALTRNDDAGRSSAAPYLRPVAGWSAGTAGSLGCNLLEEPTFSQGTIPVSFFPEVANRNIITEDGGVGRTRALVVGSTDDFGLYGEIVPIAAGFAYLFSANIDPVGEVNNANMRVSWLDEDFQQVGEEFDFVLELGRAGQFTLETLAAPAQARYAVPTISKESAPGNLVVDELVFASTDTSCAGLLRGDTP